MNRSLKICSVLLLALVTAGCGANDQDDDDPVVLQDGGSTSEDGNSMDPGMSDTGTMSDTATSADGSVTDDTGGGSDPDSGPGPDADPSPSDGIPALGNGRDAINSIKITTIADDAQGLAGPRDVEFNPESPDQLWTVNRNDHSTVILFDPGTDEQSAEKYNNFGNRHFMAKPAALAFGQPGFMATAQQEDEKTQGPNGTPADFMGPTLWSTDLSTFDGGHGGHMDMLHNSPLASGIAWDEGNAYWVFDGYHGSLTHYDFNSDHGPGGSDHSDGVLRRYVDGKVGIEKGVVAHLDLDQETGKLYAADTENQRIVVLDTDTGQTGPRVTPNYDGTDQAKMVDAQLTTLIDDSELTKPAGLELHDGHLYVTDNASSTIYAYTLDGEQVDSMDVSKFVPEGSLNGMALDDQNRIYVTDAQNHRILRLEPVGE